MTTMDEQRMTTEMLCPVTPTLTVSQQIKAKGWALKTNIESQRSSVRLEKPDGTVLAIKGGLDGRALKYVETYLADVLPIPVSYTSASEWGLTNKYLVKESGAKTFREAYDWLKSKVAEDLAEMDPNGVFGFCYTKPCRRITFAAFMEVEEDELEGDIEVSATNERQVLKLTKLGLKQITDDLFRREGSTDHAVGYETILSSMKAELADAGYQRPSEERNLDQVVTGVLTPMQALALDLNALPDWKAFAYAGGKPKSNRALKRVGAWFPTRPLAPAEFLEELEIAVRREARKVFDGYSSDRELAIGLLASRKSQISVEGGLIQYRGLE